MGRVDESGTLSPSGWYRGVGGAAAIPIQSAGKSLNPTISPLCRALYDGKLLRGVLVCVCVRVHGGYALASRYNMASLLSVSAVGQVLGGVHGAGVSVVIVVRARVRVVRVGNNLVALFALLVEELLERDDGGQDEGDLSDDQGLEGDQGEGTEGERQQSGGLQLEEEEQREEQLLDLLLLATSCRNGRRARAGTSNSVRTFDFRQSVRLGRAGACRGDLPSSSERCMSSIDSFGTWNWRVWVPRKRAARSTSSPSISDSRASGSAGREMSFRERPLPTACSVWTNLIPSVISKSPSAASARRSARSYGVIKHIARRRWKKREGKRTNVG